MASSRWGRQKIEREQRAAEQEAAGKEAAKLERVRQGQIDRLNGSLDAFERNFKGLLLAAQVEVPTRALPRSTSPATVPGARSPFALGRRTGRVGVCAGYDA